MTDKELAVILFHYKIRYAISQALGWHIEADKQKLRHARGEYRILLANQRYKWFGVETTIKVERV